MNSSAAHPRSWLASIGAAALIVLERPATWPLSLTGFLARGGIVVLLLPIVVLPTPSGVADVIGPAIIPFAFGVVAPAFVLLVAGIVALVAIWVVLGGLAGAWADVELIRDVAAADDGVTIAASRRRVMRAFVVRLLASVPLAIALSFAAVEIVTAAYAELTSPIEVVTPLFIRVLSDVPGGIALVVAAWALSEAAGGIATRHAVVGGASVAAALRDGWLDFVRRPISTIATLAVTDVVVVAAVLSTMLAAAVAWSFARYAMLAGDLVRGPLAVVALTAIWLGGLVLIGVATAWRSAVWTLEIVRTAVVPDAPAEVAGQRGVGTFGGPEHARPGG